MADSDLQALAESKPEGQGLAAGFVELGAPACELRSAPARTQVTDDATCDGNGNAASYQESVQGQPGHGVEQNSEHSQTIWSLCSSASFGNSTVC